MADKEKLVDDALLAMMLAAVTGNAAVLDEANACLNEPETKAALLEAGMIKIGPQGEADLTEAGFEHVQELQETLDELTNLMKEVVAGQQEDWTGKPACKVQLTFRFEELTCWRTIVVPAHITYEEFHSMIQATMGWMNYHLYDFGMWVSGKEVRVSWPDYSTGEDPDLMFAAPGDEGEGEWVCSDNVYLDELVPDENIMLYSYDYGDGWEIIVEIVGEQEMEQAHPVCLGGEGDAPPEDVGGEWGFQDFLDVIGNKDDPEYADMMAWGRSQGFERFNLAAVNERLATWSLFVRSDAYLMSKEAQMRAFGEVRYTGPSGASRGQAKAKSPKATLPSKDILDGFERALKATSLSEKTRSTHLDNATTYLEEYLAEQGQDALDDPCERVRVFMEEWIPKNNFWVGVTAMRQMSTSMKKLYRSMVDMDLMDMDDWRGLNAYISARSERWAQSRRSAPTRGMWVWTGN